MKKIAQKRMMAIVLAISMMISLMPAAFAVSAKEFTDVSSTAWYYDSVDYAAEHGLFNGTGNGLFSPEASMTRGMFVTVLARLDGDGGSDAVNPYNDVASGAWYAGEVAWAADNGIVTGIGGNKFAPDQAVSRQEMAAFIARYVTYYAKKHNVTFKATESDAAFRDADKIAAYASKAVTLCRSYGLVNGNPDGTFGPETLSTRAQVAAVSHRLALLLETGAAAVVTPPSGGSSGGGGGGGGSSASNSAKTAAGFIEAAQKSATNVTATVEQDNTISVNDDITITNNSVRTLTLNLNNASIGNLTVNSTDATQIYINGDTASVSSLTINAPKATVTNKVTVNGSVDIQAVSNNTFNNQGKISGTIVLNGPGAVNDTQTTPVSVVIATEERVIVRGNSTAIEVTADKADVTVTPGTNIQPIINCSAAGVNLIVNAGKATIGGTVEKVTTSNNEQQLTIEGKVGKLNAKSSSTLTLNGGGSVDALSTNNTDVTIQQNDAALRIATAEMSGGTITAPNGAVDIVQASGNVMLKTSAKTVKTELNTTLTVDVNCNINTVQASGDVKLEGTGSVQQLDVTSDQNTIISIPANFHVSAVNKTGDGSVTVSSDGDKSIVVTDKAATPTNVVGHAPQTVDGEGTITGVDSTMEYKKADLPAWTSIEKDKDAVSVVAGTYQVRVQATSDKLASEIVSVTIPAAVGVTDAAIQGKPYVGQTLSAVANANATGTLAYQWKADETDITGATAKTFKLTDDQIGKTITVTISNYSKSDATSPKTDTIVVDKTALNKLLAKAAEVQQGVSEKDNGTTAAQVAEGIVFVTEQERKVLLDAVSKTEDVVKNDAQKTAEVTAQETALRSAIETYVQAKKIGTYNAVSALQSELKTLIAAAGNAKVTTVADDAATVAPNTKWVNQADQTTYEAAISAATNDKERDDSTVLAKAIANLNAAMNTYIKAIRNGAVLDNTALQAAINAAEINATSVVVSSDKAGKDVLPSQSWVTENELDTYNGAISQAKENMATVQKDNTDALAKLNVATKTFNTAKKPGTKDIVAPIVTNASAQKTSSDEYSISFTSNEVGSYSYQYGSTEGTWSKPESFKVADKPTNFSFTTDRPGATLYVQVSDTSGNVTIVQVQIGEVLADAEASIGGFKYATLEEAVAAATKNQTVKLLKDVTIEKMIVLDQSITFDLNGHRAAHTSGNNFVQVINDATLTINGTTSDSQFYGRINLGIATDNNGSAVLNGGTYTCAENQTVLHINGTCKSSDVTITGAKITSPSDNGIQLNGCGEFDIRDSKISGATGIYVKSGNLTIENCEIIGNKNPVDYEYNGNGANATGDALVVDACNYPGGDPQVKIKGNSTFNGSKAAVGCYHPSDSTGTPAKIVIESGTFTGASSNPAIGYTSNFDTNAPTISITGGTFSSEPDAKYIAAGYETTESADNTYTVTKKSGPADAEASIGGFKYATLEEAVAAATKNQTVKLLKDVTIKKMIVLDQSITFDLNGHRAAHTSGNNFVQVTNDATLTIDGTTSDSQFYGRINLGIATDNNGSAVLNGGTYTCAENQTVLHINGTCKSSDVTITGATITSPSDNGIQLNGCGKFDIRDSKISGATGIYVKSGKLTIENCEITGNKDPVNYEYNGNGANATGDALVVDACNYPGGDPQVTIKGNSTFNGSKAAVGCYHPSDSTGTPASIAIESGTFTGASSNPAIGYTCDSTVNAPTISITGGTFSSEPDVKYIVAGYETTETGGRWTVRVSPASE